MSECTGTRSKVKVEGKTVRYGCKGMPIQKHNPKKKKSFCARHKCKQKKDKTKPGYWSCKAWDCPK